MVVKLSRHCGNQLNEEENRYLREKKERERICCHKVNVFLLQNSLSHAVNLNQCTDFRKLKRQ